MTAKDLHYYEPTNGHGLKHDPFNAIIAPRPIGWISSRDAKGNINLAPYSFFNGFCYHPPIIGFSSTSWKDSVQNIQETGEFVWNLATMDLAKQMNATAAHVAHDVSEFKIAGLTAVPGKLVNVPRVAESPVSFECKLTQIIQLQGADGEKAQAWLTLGEVVAVHIDKAMIKDGVYQTALARPIVRAGRRGDYFEIRPENMFEMIAAGLILPSPRPACGARWIGTSCCASKSLIAATLFRNCERIRPPLSNRAARPASISLYFQAKCSPDVRHFPLEYRSPRRRSMRTSP